MSYGQRQTRFPLQQTGYGGQQMGFGGQQMGMQSPYGVEGSSEWVSIQYIYPPSPYGGNPERFTPTVYVHTPSGYAQYEYPTAMTAIQLGLKGNSSRNMYQECQGYGRYAPEFMSLGEQGRDQQQYFNRPCYGMEDNYRSSFPDSHRNYSRHQRYGGHRNDFG